MRKIINSWNMKNSRIYFSNPLGLIFYFILPMHWTIANISTRLIKITCSHVFWTSLFTWICYFLCPTNFTLYLAVNFPLLVICSHTHHLCWFVRKTFIIIFFFFFWINYFEYRSRPLTHKLNKTRFMLLWYNSLYILTTMFQ